MLFVTEVPQVLNIPSKTCQKNDDMTRKKNVMVFENTNK